MENDEEDHALVADEVAPTEFALMANTSAESKRSDKNKEGLGYSVVPPTPAQLYLSPKKDLSWIGLPECPDHIVTDYSRPSPTVENTSGDDQNINPSVFEIVASPITPKPFIKFVKPKDSQSKSKTVRSHYRAPWVPTINRTFPPVNRKFPTASRKFLAGSTKCSTADMGMKGNAAVLRTILMIKGYWDSGCSRHMTGNISYLSDFEPFDGGYVSFGQGGCKITGKGTIKTGKLEFENVYFVKDLKYNLFSVSQICDNKNSVLFTDSECIVLGRDFKLLDDANIFLRTPRQHNMYSIHLNNIVPHRDLTCLVAKTSADECILWHRRLVTDDFSRITWTFFLKSKDETSGILKKFITEIENLKDLKVKIIRCDNGGEFRNKEMNDFCSQKGIKREFSNARTPRKNGVAKRRNRTLIEADRTMLSDAKLPVTFWAEAVNTACYVQNRVLVNKSHNKTLYELFNGRSPAIGFLKPFGYYVMMLNTLDNLGKFKEKGDEGTKDAANQEVKKDASSLRYIVLPKWAHYALLEFSLSKPQDHSSTEVPEGSGNPNPTASTSNPPADPMETLTVESPILTVSLPFLTTYSTNSQDPSSDARLISKRVANQEETPSLDNILSLTHQFEDILGVSSNSNITTRKFSSE
nr:ribonuclease H-like domain-containing protein [Tanacetum cinerariifolium]